MNYTSWFEQNYPFLSNFGLWLRGGEINTIAPHEFDSRPYRVLITRLSTYRDTANSFTHKLLHQIVAKISGIYPDLAYLPPPKDAELMSHDNVPWLWGTTSKRGARDFNVIAFSLSIVQELLNISTMMKKSALPLGKQERLLDESIPLIILGGASALYTSALFNNNPLVDGIFIGHDAGTIAKLFTLCRDCHVKGLSKAQTLIKLTKTIPGFFEPDKEPKAVVFHSPKLSPAQLLETGPILFDEEAIGKGNLQLSEGCSCFCSFCAESFSRKPYREFDVQTLLKAAKRMKATMGVDDLELYSFNFNMYRDFYKLLWELTGSFPSIGLKSQRFDSIALDPELPGIQHAVGKSSVTCGIEGISTRMRAYLHKSLSDKDLKNSLMHLISTPLRELKIFLIVTGLEQEADLDDFRSLCRYLQTVMQTSERKPRIIFSATILVRFPWTPLEFEDAVAVGVCKKVIMALDKIVLENSFEFRASASASDYWLSQTLARANSPAIGASFQDALFETGYIYYRDTEPGFLASVKKHLALRNVSEDSVLKSIGPSERASAPWSALQSGVDESFLIKQWESARQFKDCGYCAGTRAGTGTCMGCSACKDPAAIKAVNAQPIARTYSAAKLKERIRTASADGKNVLFKMIIAPPLRGISRKMAATALSRAIMLSDDFFTPAYRGYGSSALFKTYSSNWLLGEDVLTLVWNSECIDALYSRLKDPEFIASVNNKLGSYGTFIGLASESDLSVKITLKSPFPFNLVDFAKGNSLKFMTKRITPDYLHHEISKDSLKKKILVDCFSKQNADGSVEVTCTPGPKFNLDEFAQTAFILPQKQEWVRIEMIAHQ